MCGPHGVRICAFVCSSQRCHCGQLRSTHSLVFTTATARVAPSSFGVCWCGVVPLSLLVFLARHLYPWVCTLTFLRRGTPCRFHVNLHIGSISKQPQFGGARAVRCRCREMRFLVWPFRRRATRRLQRVACFSACRVSRRLSFSSPVARFPCAIRVGFSRHLDGNGNIGEKEIDVARRN